MKKIVFAFATLTLAVASAANHYTIRFYESAQVGGQILKPGEYTVEMKDNRAVIKSGKQTVEAEARIEKQEQKFPASVVRYAGEEGNYKLDEIRFGGTTTKVVFTKPQAAGN